LGFYSFPGGNARPGASIGPLIMTISFFIIVAWAAFWGRYAWSAFFLLCAVLAVLIRLIVWHRTKRARRPKSAAAPPIPLADLETYRAVATAYRNARKKGGKQDACQAAATNAVKGLTPTIADEAARAKASEIISFISTHYANWFWK
jgi:hypothetical protein